jgi:hypothetical protein
MVQHATKLSILFHAVIHGILLTLALFLPAKAGMVMMLSKPTEIQGPLTLSPTGIQIQGATPTQIALPDILEANFSDGLQVNYFSSIGDVATQLPPDWKGQDLAKAEVSGSASYANGELTVNSPQLVPANGIDGRSPCFVVGPPWRGDGQWTFRIKSADAFAGFILGDHVPFNAHIGISNWDSNWDQAFMRDMRGGTCCDRFTTQGVIPVWYRITRQGSSFTFQSSKDGNEWDFCVQKLLDLPTDLWALFFTNGHAGKDGGKVVFDQMVFTPASGPTSAPGVLLCSGSFMAGSFQSLDFSSDAPVGQFNRGGQVIPVSAAQIAQVVFHSEMRKRLGEADNQVGIAMKNGDFVAGTFDGITSDSAALTSLLMGIETYTADEMSACVLHPLKPIPADYEIRLKDGSALLAKGLEAKDGKLVVDEISGLEIPVTSDDIAQIRAGTSRAQSLTFLDWKVTKPPGEKAAVRASSAPDPAVCWTGGNQEQIMAMTPGTSVDFPLGEQYRAVALSLALPPQSPAKAQATLRVLADGKEILETLPVHAGEPPRFTEFNVPPSKTLTLVAVSASPNVRVLVVDPTIIREDSL